MKRTLGHMTLMAALALAVSGCDDRPQAKSGAPKATPPQDDTAREAPAPSREDLVRQALEATAEACEVDAANALKKCEGDHARQMAKLLKKQRLAAYPTLVEALGDEDQELRRVAAHSLEKYTLYFLDDALKDPAALDAEATRELIERVKSFDPAKGRLVMSTIKIAVMAGIISGLDEEVRGLIEHFDPAQGEAHAWARYHAVRNTMTYGRMAYFELAKAGLESPHVPLQLAAFEAPQQMPRWSDEESAEICGWAVKLLKEDDSKWNAGPARLMLRCNDATNYRTHLLDEASRRIADGRYGRPFSMVMSKVCAESIPGRTPPAGETICARAEMMLRKIASDEQMASRERAFALKALAEQFPDQETIAFITPFGESEDAALARAAGRMLRKLRGEDRKGHASTSDAIRAKKAREAAAKKDAGKK